MSLLLVTLAAAAKLLTLDQALDLADRQQPTLLEARAAYQEAAARDAEARALLLPQVGLTGQFIRHTDNRVSQLPGAPAPSWVTRDTLSGELAGTQVLFDLGLYGRWRSARENAQAARSTEEAVRGLVRATVRLSFFGARASRELVSVAQDAVDNQQKHLATVQGFVKVGSRPEIDLAQSQGDEATARLALIRAQNAYETAKAVLNQAMGVDGPTDFEIESQPLGSVDGEEVDLESLLPLALQSRPDLLAANRQLDAARYAVQAAQGGYGPSLSLAGRLTSSNDIGQRFNPGPLGQQVPNVRGELDLTWPVFNGFLTRSQVEEARGALAYASAARGALAQQARLDLDRALLAVKAAKAEQVTAGEAWTAVKERLRLAEGRYSAGAGSILELDDAQLAATEAAAQKVQSDYDLASARAGLLLALGRP